MARHLKRLLPPLLAATLCTSAAHAGEGRVDQAEKLEIDKGELETELQSILVPTSHGEDEAWKIAPTVEYGLSDALSVGVEVEFEKDDAEALQFSEIGFQAKWIALDPQDAALGLGIQTSLIIAHGGMVGSETYVIAEHVSGKTDITANIIIATEPGDWNEIATSYVARVDRTLGEHVTLGVETGGEVSGEARGRHWIGPVLTLSAAENSALPSLEVSVFAPLTRTTPDVQFRLELDWAF